MDLQLETTIAEIMRAEARLEDLRRSFGRVGTVSARNLYLAEGLVRRAKALCLEVRRREAVS